LDRSTIWRARRQALGLAVACAVLGVGLGEAVLAGSLALAPETVHAAIVTAVQARVGPDAHVEIEDLRIRGRAADARAILAVLDPSARVGQRVRVVLKGLQGRGRSVRMGEADCLIRVRTSHYAVRRPVARGEHIPPDAVQRAEGWLIGGRLQRPVRELGDARAARDLAPGDILSMADVTAPPAIRSGDRVRLHWIDGRIAIALEGIAAQHGHVGDVILVVNPSSGRMVRARVVGPQEVEFHHGT
jgi:flagella basal body P-ring formation protein FlgA